MFFPLYLIREIDVVVGVKNSTFLFIPRVTAAKDVSAFGAASTVYYVHTSVVRNLCVASLYLSPS